MPLLDLIIIVVFIFIQARITYLLMRWSARRYKGRTRTAVWAAALIFDVLVLGLYALSSTDLLIRFGMPPSTDVVAGAVALGYLMTATMWVVLHAIFTVIRKQLGGDTDPRRRRVLNFAGGTLMASPLAVMAYGAFVERFAFRVREVDIPLPGLPADLDGLRLLQLSDIHLSAFLSEREFARVIDASNEIRPNLALVTGDLISSYGDPLDACLRQIARLKAGAGIFGCMGNHEHYARAERYAAEAGARLGIRFLRYRARQLRFGKSVLNLAGVDYQSMYRKKDYLKGAEHLLVPGAVNVLLSHNPDVFPAAVRQGYDLVCSGHTHGGQVTIEILDFPINPARLLTPYIHGLFREGASAAYVTRGIGTIGIPARIGAPPEISVLRLRKA